MVDIAHAIIIIIAFKIENNYYFGMVFASCPAANSATS